MDVLEHEQRRLVPAECLDESASSEERHRAVDNRPAGLQPEERCHLRRHLFRTVFGNERGYRLLEFAERVGNRIGVEDSGDLLHLCAECRVRRPSAVRQAAATHDTRFGARDGLAELCGEACLADAGRAQNRHQMGPSLGGNTVPDPLKEHELAVPADDRRARRPMLRGERDRFERKPGAHRVRLSLRNHRIDLAVADASLGCAERRFPDENSIRRCGGLETRCRIDDVARRDSLALGRIRSPRDDCFSGVDGDPHLEVEIRILRVQLLDCVANCDRGPDGALRVVTMRERRAEHADDGIADELLDCSSEPLELLA